MCLLQLGGLRVPRVPGAAVHPGEGRLSSLRGLEWEQQLQNRAPAFLQTHQVRRESVRTPAPAPCSALLLFQVSCEDPGQKSEAFFVCFLCRTTVTAR